MVRIIEKRSLLDERADLHLAELQSSVVLPRFPLNAFVVGATGCTAIVDAVEVRLVTGVVPPSATSMSCTVMIPEIIVLVGGGEVHSAMVVK